MKLLRYLLPLTTLSLYTISNFASITIATAQIIPDNSLGVESSTVNPDVINGVPSDRVDGGAIRGSNLFHSFQEFNIDAGRGAYFSNPANITNILTRVTGNNPSNILGRLGVLGNANLFLLNPKGVFFGPNASLDLRGGSFFGSTADSVLFDNFEFSASNLQPVPQLTINIPIGLRFRDNPGNITSNSSLQVQSGQSLSLIGGDVSLNGGLLEALKGRIELGGLAEAGTVGFNPDGSLTFPNNVARGNVTLSNQANVSVFGQGGSIAVNARNLDIFTGSGLFAGIPSDANSDAQAGDIVINATDRVRIEGDSNSSISIINVPLVGKAGDIVINTSILEGTGRFLIGSGVFGQGNAAGNVTIAATDRVSLQGLEGFNSGISSLVADLATGNAGNITINTRSLSLSNFALLTSTLGQGNGGNIEINASESVSLNGSNSILSALTSSSGKAGNIIINTPSLSLSNRAAITTFTSGQGNAGTIQINAANSVSLGSESSLLASTFSSGNAGDIIIDAPNATVSFDGVGTSASTSVFGESNLLGVDYVGTGQGGDIKINARSLSLSNGASLFTYTDGEGNAGTIQINAANSVSLGSESSLVASTFSSGNAGDIIIDAPNATVSFDGVGTSASTSVFNQSNGQGGDIKINARSLSLSNGASLFTDTAGEGNAGNVTINATDNIQIAGVYDNSTFTGISSAVLNGARGDAGNIEINTGSLFVTNAGQLLSNTNGQGNGGSITINARDTVSFDGTNNEGAPSAAFSNVESGGEGNGGDISITANSLFLTNGGELNTFIRGGDGTNPGGIGKAGNVKLNITNTTNISGISENGTPSGIFSSVGTGAIGDAGNIEITTGSLFVSDDARIIASTSGQGNAGSIKINANSFLLDAALLNTNSDIENRQAGNIYITTTKDIRLDNGALISAQTQGGQGNIFLNSRDLILRRNSNITTNATGIATGGNITIHTGNLVALENSDISANSQESFGGRVLIRADAIFGTQFRDQPTPESDITATGASPEFAGTVQIDTADVDPSQGLVELPENLADASDQIAQNPCQKGSGSEFIVTGRGGLPSSPNDNFSSDNVRVDLVNPAATSSSNSQAAINKQSVTHTNAKSIIPAQGWVFNNKGEVVLTAYDPTTTSTPERSSQANAACPAF
jgi:filamentous hemagglutinin family protein